jgi:PBP4 family serine-type D-alanyl-D-alanine carboxypeptidase
MIVNRRDAETQGFFEAGFVKRNVDARFCSVLLSLFVLCASASLRFDQAQAKTLSSETQQQINAILDAPNLREAHIGISILDLGTVKDAQAFPAKPYVGKPHRVLFERDANKSFMPASNMKLFTAAIALQLLGKEKTFPTRVWEANQKFLLVGGGDPSLELEGIVDLAQQIAARGVKNYNDINSDGSLFVAETNRGRYPFGWTLDDTYWYYGPEISALAIERNQIDLVVTGGAKAGYGPSVVLNSPIAPNFVTRGSLTTVEPDVLRKRKDETIELSWSVRKPPYYEKDPLFTRDMLTVLGQVTRQQEVNIGAAIPDPPRIAGATLIRELKKLNIERNFDPFPSNPKPPFPVPGAENSSIYAEHNSPPLKVLFQRFLKNSDNLYAEMLLRDAAYYFDGTGGDKAGPHAHELLKKWLIGQGIDITALRFEDGSGLSRYNLLTPRATAELLAAINAMKDGDVIWNALPIGGVDGTMKNRVKSTPAQSNARAKSGTFSIASNLSGYVTTRDNHRLAVSLYMNFARDGDAARKAQDAVFVALAGSTINGTK